MGLSWLLTELSLVIGLLLGILLITRILLQQRTPAGTMSWLLIILLLPWVGVPLYLLFGGRKMRRTAERKVPLVLVHRPDVKLQEDAAVIDRLLCTYGLPCAEAGNRVELCTTGEQTYHRLTEMIEKAANSIYISIYILQKDEIGRDIRDRLTRKAQSGVDVRVLMDGVGSLHTYRSFFKPLIRAGGHIAYFIPVLRRPFHGRTNLRNHRKIVITDQRQVLAGGTNIGREYMGPTPSSDRWQDLAFILQGPSVRHYLEVFRADWVFTAGDDIPVPSIDPAVLSSGKTEDITQVVPAGPDVPSDALYDALLSAVYGAQQQLWVVTPYFVPDESLFQALSLAARRGVDVRMLIPKRSNHLLADIVRGNYLRELQRAGAKIYLYDKGMMHAKIVLVDTEVMILGSANIDIRSLFLNYEIAMFCYSHSTIKRVSTWVETLMRDSRIGVKEVSFVRSLCEAVLRLFAPLL